MLSWFTKKIGKTPYRTLYQSIKTHSRGHSRPEIDQEKIITKSASEEMTKARQLNQRWNQLNQWHTYNQRNRCQSIHHPQPKPTNNRKNVRGTNRWPARAWASSHVLQASIFHRDYNPSYLGGPWCHRFISSPRGLCLALISRNGFRTSAARQLSLEFAYSRSRISCVFRERKRHHQNVYFTGTRAPELGSARTMELPVEPLTDDNVKILTE